MSNKVWYVTGASKGLGLALVKKLLSQGYKVAATSRTAASLAAAAGNYDEQAFLPLEVDLADENAITRSIQQAHKFFGSIDVVVNNAGYGIGGAVEELSTKETEQSFEVNVFAPIAVIKAVMPILRGQQSGHIINIASIAGFAPATGWGMYAATKYALMGLTEVLAEDVKEFGIKATVVAPGAFRTEFLKDSSLVIADKKMKEYTAIRSSHTRYANMNGTQLGDPDKAADVLIALTKEENPPVRFFMGSDAVKRAEAKISQLTEELNQWKGLSASTDFS